MPELEQRCLESWDRAMPEYRKIRWNEERFDINSLPYVKQAYAAKKYAFVSDVVRIYALYYHGGIYLDTDVEVTRSFDSFLRIPAFAGLESPDFIATCVIGAQKKHPWTKCILKSYVDRPFLLKDGHMDLTTNVKSITKMTKKKFGWKPGNQIRKLKDGLHIYPEDYFCPKSWETKQLHITENTHAIHHFSSSWWDI